MRFVMSTRLAWGANYCNEEGQVVFRTESPGPNARGQDIKVFRVVPPSIDSNPEVASEADLRDFYENIGEVNYRVYSSSSIVHRGTCHPTDTFFTKGVFRSSWRRDRIFRGQDGKEYVWKPKIHACELYLNDSSDTPLAKFHDRKFRVLSGPNPAALEIFSAGEHMVELILMTFIYVEKLRGDREAPSKSHYKPELK